MRSRWGILLAVVVLATACSDSDNTESARRGATSDAAEAASGTLRIAEFSDVITFDPAGAQPTQATFLFPAYDTLLRQNAEHELVPHLATAWSQPDATTWRFTLRDDVTFHDGSAFDGGVVKANLERAKASTTNPNAPTFATMTSVEVIDPTTVDVRFSTPRPNFLIDMSLVPGMMISAAAIASNTDFTRDPQGSGPWRWDRGASQDGARQVYERNVDYWAPELQGVERIEISVVADNQARFSAVRSGQVDIAHYAPPDLIDAAEDAGLVVESLDVEAHWFEIFDREGTLVPALADPRVRQAIAYAIDREGYVAAVFEGLGSSSGGLIPPALDDWYDETLAGVPAFDPARSKALLKEAGYPDGFAMDLPSMPVIRASVEAIAQMLADVGIRANIVPLQNGQLGAEVRNRSFPVAFVPTVVYHPLEHLELFASPSGPYNPFHVPDDAEIDTRLVRAAAEAPEAARKAYTEIIRDVIDDGIMIPVAFEPVVAVVQRDVSGAFIPLGIRTTIPYGVRVDGP